MTAGDGAAAPARHVAVVGGGVGGLLAAHRLERAGAKVTLFESAAQLGGVVATTHEDGYLHEHAASSFLAKPGGMVDLCRELDVPVVRASKIARRRWIFIDGERREVPSGPWSLLRTNLLTARGKLALLGEPLRAARDVEKSGDESVYDFAARRLGPEMARAMVAPFVGGIFAADAHDISLQAGFPMLAELDAHGGLVRGMLRKAFGGGRPRKSAPARARRGRGEGGLWAPERGMASVVDALARGLRGEVRLRCAVDELAPVDGGVEVRHGERAERFDGVIAALPAQVLSALLPKVPEAARRLGEIQRAPAAVVSLGYRRDEFEAPLDGFGMLIAAGERARVLGVVYESVLWPGRAEPDRILLRCVLAGSRDPTAFELDDEALMRTAAEDIAATLGVTATPVHRAVTRRAAGIAPFRVGHRERLAAAEAALRRHRILLAGADYRGVGLNGICLDTPAVVAEALAW
ncbi:MAG: protoporphyrinogen oxidase [Kofleriaceae bacterium]